MLRVGVDNADAFEIHNSASSPLVPAMIERLYARLQRKGYLPRDIERMVNHERNIFAALMVDMGEAARAIQNSSFARAGSPCCNWLSR